MQDQHGSTWINVDQHQQLYQSRGVHSLCRETELKPDIFSSLTCGGVLKQTSIWTSFRLRSMNFICLCYFLLAVYFNPLVLFWDLGRCFHCSKRDILKERDRKKLSESNTSWCMTIPFVWEAIFAYVYGTYCLCDCASDRHGVLLKTCRVSVKAHLGQRSLQEQKEPKDILQFHWVR
jgi:hypothetical protein